MANSADAARRRLGLIFLSLALGLLVLGLTVLRSELSNRLVFVLYWLTCFGFTILAMLTALLDAWITRIRARQRQEDLFQRTLMGRKSPDAGDE